MSFLKKRSMRFSLGIFLILTLALWGSVATAFADSGGATATLAAGTLSEQGTFGQNVTATLTGRDQLVPYPLPIQPALAPAGTCKFQGHLCLMELVGTRHWASKSIMRWVHVHRGALALLQISFRFPQSLLQIRLRSFSRLPRTRVWAS